MNNVLIIFDLEATCGEDLPKHKREIIEVGAVKVLDGNVIDTFQKFIKPKNHNQLSQYCKDLTHISQKEIDGASHPKEVLQTFIEWAGNAVFASWGDFDANIMQKELHKNKLTATTIIQFVNLQRIYMAVKKLPLSISLSDALKKEHIVNEANLHRAYDDAFNTYKIYKKNETKINAMMSQYYSKLR